ncbi:MAG TPA: AbrB/MazE/SpoVT family DNA-binding domain-containing protein [Thermoprotei archaeon]|nr:AbrB/MazE/SpoVT family DNA-binding domain-containing protein [Thermoprotei archaeon]
MDVIVSKVSKKGLVTIPMEIRRRFGIEVGDLIIWSIDEKDNAIILHVIKDPLKYLEGKYDDSEIVYEVVEETADSLIQGEVNAGN